MSNVEDEIRRIVNEELDRRLKEDNLAKLIAEGKISINDARKRLGYCAVPVPEGSDARSILDGEWVDNSVGMPEPEVPWRERHDRKTYVSETPYGDAEVTTVPENRCRWCNELIASDGPFWYHLESRVAGCEGFNRIAEPEVPWKHRHDRPIGWYHVCENSGGVPVDILLPIGAECSDCGAYLSDDGNVKKES